jgi:Ca2+-binding RTX toxin-like protein
MKSVKITIAATLAVLLGTATVAVASGSGPATDRTVIGTPGKDRIETGAGSDTVWALGGGDWIRTGDGNDDVEGDGDCPAGTQDPDYCEGSDDQGGEHGDGNHGHHGGNKGCRSRENKKRRGCDKNFDGNDTIDTGNGDDSVNAGGGDDKVAAGAGNDNVDAGSGDDEIDAGPGADVVDAGSGNDEINVRDGSVDVVWCGTGKDSVTADANDVLHNCEKVSLPPKKGGKGDR